MGRGCGEGVGCGDVGAFWGEGGGCEGEDEDCGRVDGDVHVGVGLLMGMGMGMGWMVVLRGGLLGGFGCWFWLVVDAGGCNFLLTREERHVCRGDRFLWSCG